MWVVSVFPLKFKICKKCPVLVLLAWNVKKVFWLKWCVETHWMFKLKCWNLKFWILQEILAKMYTEGGCVAMGILWLLSCLFFMRPKGYFWTSVHGVHAFKTMSSSSFHFVFQDNLDSGKNAIFALIGIVTFLHPESVEVSYVQYLALCGF